jgi:hypothetical protein
MTERPPYLDYPAWLQGEHGITVDQRLKNRYETTVRAIRSGFADSPFWQGLPDQLREADAAYQVSTGYQLLVPSERHDLLLKSFDSYILKTYRKNVVLNPTWPDPPVDTGWLLPPDVSAVHDAVRTLMVVKYLDGPRFLSDRLAEHAAQTGLSFRADFEAREEGYYAAHAYVSAQFEVPAQRWDTETLTSAVEIQITTQVQEVIRRLLHRYYERQRMGSGEPLISWQWDYESDEFNANYLGHILHYVEGMIMDIRGRQTKEAPG